MEQEVVDAGARPEQAAVRAVDQSELPADPFDHGDAEAYAVLGED